MKPVINKTSKTILEDNKISIAIMSSFAILTLQYLILIYFNLIGTPSAYRIQLISKIVVGFFYIIALPTVLRRNKFKFLAVFFISIFIFLLNFLLFNENWIFLKDVIFPYFFTCLPSLIYSYSISDWNVLESVMKKTSLLVFIIGSIIGILVFSNRASIGAYSMSISYYLLLPTIVYMDEFLERFTFRSIIIVLVSLVIILVLGSRGAILCVGIFVILKIIRMGKKLSYKTILLYITIPFLMTTFFLSFDIILQNLHDFLLHFGIRSRNITLFLRDQIYLSGRDRLYKDIIQEISKNPILGIGLAGDRRVLGGYYSHNIVLEILGDFGIIAGSLVILSLGILIFIALFYSKDKVISNIIYIWFSIGLVHLMISSSYLIDFKFWIFLGLSLRAVLDKGIMKFKKAGKEV